MNQPRVSDDQVQQLLADLDWHNLELSSYWHSGFRDDMLDVNYSRLRRALNEAPVELLQLPAIVAVLRQIADRTSTWWQDFWRDVQKGQHANMARELDYENLIGREVHEAMARVGIS